MASVSYDVLFDCSDECRSSFAKAARDTLKEVLNEGNSCPCGFRRNPKGAAKRHKMWRDVFMRCIKKLKKARVVPIGSLLVLDVFKRLVELWTRERFTWPDGILLFIQQTKTTDRLTLVGVCMQGVRLQCFLLATFWNLSDASIFGVSYWYMSLQILDTHWILTVLKIWK